MAKLWKKSIFMLGCAKIFIFYPCQANAFEIISGLEKQVPQRPSPKLWTFSPQFVGKMKPYQFAARASFAEQRAFGVALRIKYDFTTRQDFWMMKE